MATIVANQIPQINPRRLRLTRKERAQLTDEIRTLEHEYHHGDDAGADFAWECSRRRRINDEIMARVATLDADAVMAGAT